MSNKIICKNNEALAKDGCWIKLVYYYISWNKGNAYINGTMYGTSYSPWRNDWGTSCYQLFAFNYNVTTAVVNNTSGKLTTIKQMFYTTPSITSIDVSDLDTSNVTDMSFAFRTRSSVLRTLDLSSLDTSKVTDMYYMLADNNAISSYDVSNFDTSNVTTMSYMFGYNTALSEVNLTNFDTSNVTNMSYMFVQDSALTTLDLSSFDTSNVIDMIYMFDTCSNLVTLDLANFDISQTNLQTTGMFRRCNNLTTIYVDNCNDATISKLIAILATAGYSFGLSVVEGRKALVKIATVDIGETEILP